MRGAFGLLAEAGCALLACSAVETTQPTVQPAALSAPALRGKTPPRGLFAMAASARALDAAVRCSEWPAADARLGGILSAWTEAGPLVRTADAKATASVDNALTVLESSQARP